MTFNICVFALSLTLGVSASASAQVHPFAIYESALLVRPMPAAVKEYCAGKAGKENTPAYKACRITRLFIADIAANKDAGYPPSTDLSYMEDAEADMLLKTIKKYAVGS